MNRISAYPVRRALVIGSLALLIVVMIALWVLDHGSERRALRNLPEADRRALYERTLENVRTVCVHDAKNRLARYCRDQAEILRALPECDAACKALVANFRRRATR
jgi:hypothetical protein